MLPFTISNLLLTKPVNRIATPYMVDGKKATKNEYNVYLAAVYYKIPYKFQVWYWGGRLLMGGQILDFLMWTPIETPVQVFGEYWHSGSFTSKDRFNIARLEAFIGRPIVILWESETETFELAKEAFRKKIL